MNKEIVYQELLKAVVECGYSAKQAREAFQKLVEALDSIPEVKYSNIRSARLLFLKWYYDDFRFFMWDYWVWLFKLNKKVFNA